MEDMTIFYIIRAVVNIYIAFLSVLLLRSALTPKQQFSSGQSSVGTFAVTMTALIINMFLWDHLIMKIIVPVLSLAFGSKLFYQDKFSRRLGIGISFMMLCILAESFMLGVIAGVYGVSGMLTLCQTNILIQTLPALFLSLSICLGGASLIFWKRRYWKSELHLDRFFILPLSQMIVIVAFESSMYMDVQSVGIWDTVVTLVVLILCIITDLVFLRMIDTLVWQKRKEEQQELQKRHYTAMMEQQRSVRKMRHDIANHLMAIELMVSENDPGAKEYSRHLMQEVQKTQMVDRCENQVADAVVYGKAAEASAGQIEFKADAQLSQTVAIDDLDLMSLLSNLLDNALTAASQAERKWVSVQIREQAGTVLFAVQNSIQAQTVPDLNQSSKRNKNSHGLGIGIIREICGRYNGTFDTTLSDDRFEVSVMLIPEKKKQKTCILA